ncbi:uncharacterized protein BDCG_17759 [Blastomyces dermatitidis ER-3]|uniref:Nucleoside phosphorylase domain-containing protein n=1 Tax=Ajellomyces dermatitidis (strain ER-3 / ATCC MYA-2586) TaxID=559297 RepID=A0ABX2W056_AJEDR|nr:uncharacterized protein BDCG_17759 [Blastomyces dermatitidis ER-3]EQL32949.1 hypothetical protein BDFG_04932 [Blastomyces dermatitidis ATCC 26199]OAT02771.1 hypothetical protein BDCG_17759 [Blastomyces dermatitidis ER-3]
MSSWLSSVLSRVLPPSRGDSHGRDSAPSDLLPDHDLHNSWGCNYSAQSVLNHERILPLWEQYGRDPTGVRRNYHNLLREYTALFRDFFDGYYPISLHGHVSDALLPTTVSSLIQNTCATSPLVLNNPTLAPSSSAGEDGRKIQQFVLDYLGWEQLHVEQPKFAVVQGLYGAAFGPLAHASKEWEMQIIASGPKPIVVHVDDDITRESLSASLAQAKAQGCIAVVVDIVSTEDGSVLSPERFKLLQTCCTEHKLWFIVDEALAAIRCGSPFAFQRSEYGNEKPDLVAFGKGLGTSGIAINFDSPMTRPLGFVQEEDILQTIMYWRALVSRPVTIPVLLEAMGVLYTAQTENWVQRSLKIGQTFYSVIQAHSPGEPVKGLGGFLALDRDISMRLHVMAGVRRRCPWVRWLPKLDAVNADREALEAHVFGPRSKGRRAKLSAEAEEKGTLPQWCFFPQLSMTSVGWEWVSGLYLMNLSYPLRAARSIGIYEAHTNRSSPTASTSKTSRSKSSENRRTRGFMTGRGGVPFVATPTFALDSLSYHLNFLLSSAAMARLNSSNEYTIGWICALPLERAPAEEMLEEKHEEPKDFKQPRTDNNVYTLGRIGGHNVVIASLPAGEYGTTPATGVAMSMLSTFPEIRFGLMVGIGAAIPREGRDIRLGDIAVCKPDGKTGGVVQYDLGKALTDDEFRRKGFLNSPPELLRNAVGKIQTEHLKMDSKIPMYISEMLKRLPSMAEARDGAAAYVHQGAKNDRLFEATYDHAGGTECTKCNLTKIIQREPRRSDKPRIHYGVIASGNTLIKSARAREKLLKYSDEDCICFEMEAAGLMNQFPCLVIRGLCDYADSHKNDQWQPYAAAAAAGYARELLHYLPVQDVGKVPTANETLNRNPNTSSKPSRTNKRGGEAGTSVPSGGSGSSSAPPGSSSSNPPGPPGSRNPTTNNPTTPPGTGNPTTPPETKNPPNGRGEGGPQTNNNNPIRIDAVFDGRWQHQWRLIWAGQHIQEINPKFASTQKISEIHLTTFAHTTWASCIVEIDLFHAPQRVQDTPEVRTTICTEASDESVPVASPFYQQVSTEAITAGQPLADGNRTWNRGAYFQPPVANSNKFKFLGRRVMGCQGKSEEGGLNLAPLNASDYRWRLKDLNLAVGPEHRIYAVIRTYSLWDQFTFRALVNVSMFR